LTDLPPMPPRITRSESNFAREGSLQSEHVIQSSGNLGRRQGQDLAKKECVHV
jgi:hypothetical protein